MSTTSLKLPDDIKQLAADAAQRQGISPHAFMVDAIRAAAIAAEQRAKLVAQAVAARKETLNSGKGLAVSEVHRYVEGRVRGKATPKPKLKTWRK